VQRSAYKLGIGLETFCAGISLGLGL